MLNVVLCGHKTLSLTAGLREDQKLRMLENRVRGDVLFVLTFRRLMSTIVVVTHR